MCTRALTFGNFCPVCSKLAAYRGPCRCRNGRCDSNGKRVTCHPQHTRTHTRDGVNSYNGVWPKHLVYICRALGMKSRKKKCLYARVPTECCNLLETYSRIFGQKTFLAEKKMFTCEGAPLNAARERGETLLPRRAVVKTVVKNATVKRSCKASSKECCTRVRRNPVASTSRTGERIALCIYKQYLGRKHPGSGWTGWEFESLYKGAARGLQ